MPRRKAQDRDIKGPVKDASDPNVSAYDADKAKQERDWWARSSREEQYIPPARRKQLIHARDRLNAVKKQIPRTLYIHRPVLNAHDIIGWAKSNGYRTTLPASDLHVTVAYSRAPVAWPEPQHEQVIVPAADQLGADRSVARFSGGATVLRFKSPQLEQRWQELRDQGASWDHDGYQPHVTLSYQHDGHFDPAFHGIHGYMGPIMLGGEQLAEVSEDWKDGVVEKAINPEQKTTFRIVGREDPDETQPTKQPQAEVNYQLTPADNGDRCGRCSMFRPPMSCSNVVDPISADGWCKLFAPRSQQGMRMTQKSWKDDVMEKVGARHNKSDMRMLQDMHDNAVALGAQCQVHAKGDGEEAKKAAVDYRIAKVDENLGMVFGYSIICKVNGQDYYDLNIDLSGPHQGERVPEHIPEATMLKAAVEFMQTARVGNEMHKGPDEGIYIFAFPLTTDIAKAMGITSNVTGLMVGFKPPPELLAKFKDGSLKGFSIEGRRIAYQEHD